MESRQLDASSQNFLTAFEPESQRESRAYVLRQLDVPQFLKKLSSRRQHANLHLDSLDVPSCSMTDPINVASTVCDNER